MVTPTGSGGPQNIHMGDTPEPDKDHTAGDTLYQIMQGTLGSDLEGGTQAKLRSDLSNFQMVFFNYESASGSSPTGTAIGKLINQSGDITKVQINSF